MRGRQEKRRPAWLIGTIAFLTLWLLFPGHTFAAETPADAKKAEVAELLSGKTAGATTGTPQDQIIQANVPDAEILYYNTVTDMCLALQMNKIDFFVVSTVNYYSMANQYPDMGYLNVPLTTYDIGAIFPMTEDGEALRRELNEYIASIGQSGELKKLQDYWLFPKDNWEEIDIPQTGSKGILTFATANTLKPFSFMDGDRNAGFDIAVIAGFCREYGYGLRIENADFSGVLSGITTGKYDLAAGQISWTQERAENVLFSDFYYTQQIVPLVRSEDFEGCDVLVGSQDTSAESSLESDSEQTAAQETPADLNEGDTAGTDSGGDASSDSGSWNSSGHRTIWESIRRTLIDQNRWKMILNGFAVTLEITFGGFALANLLGAVFCAMVLSGNKILNGIAAAYSRLMQGLPIMVILMLLYYVVFAHSKVSNVAVAIVGFGMVFGAYMAQLFEGGIRSVDKGQMEAALAIGFTRRQAFRGIVLPQAVRFILQGYFSNLISLMKGTAVVGYIAVYDLTRAGDIIRSSTYEAFAPLLAIAVIYFVSACVLLGLMSLIQKSLAPKRRETSGTKSGKDGNGKFIEPVGGERL